MLYYRRRYPEPMVAVINPNTQGLIKQWPLPRKRGSLLSSVRPQDWTGNNNILNYSRSQLLDPWRHVFMVSNVFEDEDAFVEDEVAWGSEQVTQPRYHCRPWQLCEGQHYSPAALVTI